MVRILIFLFLIAAAAFGLGILLEQPGSLALTWFGYHLETSPLVGLSAVALAAIIGWSLFRFVFAVPSLMSVARHARRRKRGHEAIARGILAAGVGDARQAERASRDAKKYLPHEPLTLLLQAQSAQLAGDRSGAERAFAAMAGREETRLLGLRGLHAESLRQGDHDTAHKFALQAQAVAPLAWSGQAVLDRYSRQNDWEAARLCVEQNLRAKIVDVATANRQKAVLDTAMAGECELTDPERAVKLLRAAVKKAPDLTPATALLGRLLSRKGDLRGGSKLIEAAFSKTPHPDLAQAYVDMRPGDSSADRLTRAKTLAKCAPNDPESAMMIAQAALGARDFATARAAMAPLIGGGARPTARMCVIMAEIEDREHDAQGLVREWLARGSRAPRDAAWVADGHYSRQWAPVSPVTGKLDAYRWLQPKEELSGPIEEPPPAYQPPPALTVDEAPGDEGASLEILPPVAAGPELAPETPTRKTASPQPVVFPLATPPDDPGPKKQQVETRLF
jgi:HemY protein